MSKQKKEKDDSKKVKTINLRLTETEFSTINTLCQKVKISRSSYIIQATLNKTVLTEIDAQVANRFGYIYGITAEN